jgi:uracil-DNA glycosylase
VKLLTFESEAKACTHCHEPGLVHVDETRGVARPMLQLRPTGALGILIVGEAPNVDDTYNVNKGYLTYDADTDPTGRFMRSLLIDDVGLRDHEIGDVLFANAAFCLPSKRNGKYPVGKKQMDLCRPWLIRLIEDADVKVVVTMGATPLRAMNRIERHRLTLRSGVGKLHQWFGRFLLPLYHAGLLGRISRTAEQQRADIRPLREHLGR